MATPLTQAQSGRQTKGAAAGSEAQHQATPEPGVEADKEKGGLKEAGAATYLGATLSRARWGQGPQERG
ncbi:hypothetical protein V498_10066 [Pseudogymnoascus sp. VKM F-4517 (FW-2822)]|nr:hypothetical protein V498_10066 [Pseudogymnoascus sp. VKM F-4517 (FW-2822)]